MNGLGLTIAGLLLVVVIIGSIIYEANRSKKIFEKDLEELNIGNRYKMTESFLRSDDPFNPKSTFIVEITDIKLNYKDNLYVQYKQIEPEIKDEYFSSSFDRFIDVYELIK